MNRYFSFSSFLKEKFGGPVHKVVVNGGFSCPNRDGTKGESGCSFCNNLAFSPAAGKGHVPVSRQIREGMDKVLRFRKKTVGFLAYFQPYSNTYGSPEFLNKIYEEALSVPGVVGLAVGTRPDCLREEVLKVISSFARRTHFWLEIGLETVHNSTLERVRRGHSFEEFLEAYNRVRKIENIHICLHLIHGLPDETPEMMLETVRWVNRLKPEAVKFHQLEIVRDTLLAKEYEEGLVKVPSLEEYLSILGQSLRILHPGIILQRLFGWTPSEYLVAPQLEKRANYNEILNRYLEEHNIIQGERYKKSP